MKIFIVILTLFLLTNCAVASLAGTTVNAAVKVVEVPFKVIGSVLDNEDEDEENKDE